jgi:hypothetical protein
MKVNDVPFSDGAAWISEAFAIFRAQPLPWIGLMLTWLFVSMFLMLLPFIGGAISTLLQTAFFAGFMLACKEQLAGGRVMPSHLFAALQKNARVLVMVGSIVLLVTAAETMLLYALGFRLDAMVEIYRMNPADAAESMRNGPLGKELQRVMPLAMLGVALNTLVVGLFWFVAPLVAFKQMPPGHAIRWSFFAVVSNVGAMFLFGVLMTLLMILSAFTMGIALVVVLPLFMISNYTSYRRVFVEA